MNPQLPVASLPVESDITDFPELWRTVNRYKWHVAAITAVFLLIGTLVAFSAEPIYRASMTVLIEQRPDRTVQIAEAYDPGMGTDEYYPTQSELLRSRELLGRVVDKLDLANNAEILPIVPKASLLDMVRRLEFLQKLPFLPEVEPANPSAEPMESKRERAIDVLQRSVVVRQVASSQMLRVAMDSTSGPLAALMVNTLGDVFVESGLEARLQATEHVSRWLTQRLSDLNLRMEASEKALQQYREQHQLVNVGGTRTLYEEEIIDNSRKLREAQRKKTELGSTYWKIQQAGGDPRKLQEISTLLLDPLVQRAAEAYSGIQQNMKQLQERYGDKHPQMQAAQVRLESASRAYFEQLRLAANGIKAEYEIAAETERALGSVVEASKTNVRRLDQQDYQRRVLEREAQANRDLYDLFLKRFKETDTTSTYEPLNARVVDRATVPKRPAEPNKANVILQWGVGGLLLGILLATLRHVLSETIRSPEQLEQATQLAVLSVLPRVPGLGRGVMAPAHCVESPRAPFPEGVRSIRASLMLNDVDHRMKRIMFTSAMAQEGKSSIACGFAVTMGQLGTKVVLVEADLRAPSLKKMFKIPKSSPGLVEVLTGQARLQDAMFRHEGSNIDVLPVAKLPANPAEVIASAAFHKLIDELSSRYDRVIIDSPPCGAASDSLLLSHQMDAVIFVIHGGATSKRAVQTAIKHLRAARAPLLGHVLNLVDARTGYGYGGQYYAYGQYGR